MADLDDLDGLLAGGVLGSPLGPGNHVCGFYCGLSERDEVLLPYLREGLRRGEKCVCVVDATDPEVVFAALTTEPEVDIPADSDQLDVQRSMETYLRDGAFSMNAMLDFWEASVGAAVADGYPLARTVGEMTWALRQMPGVEDLVRYESEFNRHHARYPRISLCLYDIERFSAEILVDMVKTHPRVLLRGMILDNPYYLEPDEFLASRA